MTSNANPASLQMPRLEFVTCASPAGVHRMAYWEWGDPDNDRVLICVHGLTRTGRDFDPLAQRLTETYRVICPDIVGRGRSDWLINPASYVVPQYVSDILTLIARLRINHFDWIGTSMGGLIGLGLAAALNFSPTLRPDRGRYGLPPAAGPRFGKMVLNDIGPVIETDGLDRISEYVGTKQSFASFNEAVAYIKEVAADFGAHDEAGWRALTEHVFIEEDGRWNTHYDLRIAEPMRQQTQAAGVAATELLWPAYQSLQEPVLIIRGEHSDLLTQETAAEMLARNTNSQLLTIPNTGHAPTLRDAAQIEPIVKFLLERHDESH